MFGESKIGRISSGATRSGFSGIDVQRRPSGDVYPSIVASRPSTTRPVAESAL